jgi:murein DD-endopeptidase MepM/ murein hydrolase activator NlpD
LLLSVPVAAPAGGRAIKGQSTRGAAKVKAPARSQARAVAPRPARGEERCTHVVRRGESLGRVAARYRVTSQSVISANRLPLSGSLKKGQRLVIPACRGVAGRAAPVPPAVEIGEGLLLATVGPLRVPTRLHVAVPDWSSAPIELSWPLEGAIASGFGKRGRGWHAGIDIRAEAGTPILAAAAGTVVFSGWAAFYGRVVKIQHSDGFMTVYAHNNENLVEPGDVVAAGAVIATVGRSGRASAEHLHFEVRRDGMAYNPEHLLVAWSGGPIVASVAADAADDGARDQEVP